MTVVPRKAHHPPSMTAAFRAPSGCGGQFPVTTSIISYNSNDHDYDRPRQTVTVFFSDPRSFPSCQPSGFNTKAERILSFDPGVCPEQWTAYNLQVESFEHETYSTSALCCSSGFTPKSIIGIDISDFGGLYCAHEITPSGYPAINVTATVTSAPSTITLTPTEGVLIHQAWWIRWQSSDVSSLTPAPPYMRSSCSNIQIASWIPNATGDGTVLGRATDCVPHPIDQQSENDGSSLETLYNFLVIGMPLIGLTVLGFFTWFCCVRRCLKHRRRQRARREAEAMELRAAEAAKPVPQIPEQSPYG